MLQSKKKYNRNIDLVNDNVYTNFGLNPSSHSQDTEQKTILTTIKGHNCCKFAKTNVLQPQRRYCH